MSSDVAPLLVGFAVVGLLLVLIGTILAIRRLVERMRLRPRERQTRTQGGAASQEWVYRPRAGREGRAEPSGGRTIATDGGARSSSADRRPEALRRESEVEAELITEDARRQARELLEEAKLEANRIVVAAGQERARLLTEVEQERAALEERRTRVDSLAAVQGPNSGRMSCSPPPSGNARASGERSRRKQSARPPRSRRTRDGRRESGWRKPSSNPNASWRPRARSALGS